MDPNQEAEATLPGAEDAKPEYVSQRELAMNAIEEANTRQMEAELGISLASDPSAQIEAHGVDNPAPASDEVISDFGGRKVRIKVDGVVQDVSLEDMVREHQKGSAADKRLAEASALLAAAKQREQEALTLAAPVEPPPVITPGAVEERIKLATAALYEGDADAFARTISDVLAGHLNETSLVEGPSVQTLVDEVQQRIAVDTAFARIQSDYPEVIADPDIELLTTVKVNKRVDDGMSRAEAMIESAREVYILLGKALPGEAPSGAKSESRNEKLARKASMDQLPVAATAVASRTQEDPEQDSSALIREISRGRMGQSMAA